LFFLRQENDITVYYTVNLGYLFLVVQKIVNMGPTLNTSDAEDGSGTEDDRGSDD